ncbi:MAG: hypothetical protein WDM79_12825 [Terricaulis sp.]
MMTAPSAAYAQAPGWSYAYTNGVVTATQRNEEGNTTATLTCAPPTGDIIITDYTFGRAGRRATQATVSVGPFSVTVPAAEEQLSRRVKVITVHLPQRPPILAAVQPTDRLTVVVNNVTHTYLPGSATQLKDVAYGCWGS